LNVPQGEALEGAATAKSQTIGCWNPNALSAAFTFATASSLLRGLRE
jgi:hypothetical protein